MPEADTGTLVAERPPVDGEVKVHVQEAPDRQDLTDYAREAAAPASGPVERVAGTGLTVPAIRNGARRVSDRR
ncbi:hypothetical protein ACFY0B_39365 [Streptomyces sp. NPDC001797]|uniref:hypothetical protein n=1 Tax=Streptomyces sp. NPDC001797 TaxID=3364610 RepID=UPI0036A9C566